MRRGLRPRNENHKVVKPTATTPTGAAPSLVGNGAPANGADATWPTTASEKAEAGPEPNRRDWVSNMKRPDWDLDGRYPMKQDVVDDYMKYLRDTRQAPETDYRGMSHPLYKQRGWIPFTTPRPLAQEPAQQGKNLLKIKAPKPPPDLESPRKVINVHNLTGCTFIVAFSKLGMKAVHLWESAGFEKVEENGETRFLSTPNACIDTSYDEEELAEKLNEQIRDFFRENEKELQGGRVIVVMPMWVRQREERPEEWEYRYDMKASKVMNKDFYQAPKRLKLMSGVPEYIKWAAAEGTGFRQEHSTHGKAKNFFEIKYWPRKTDFADKRYWKKEDPHRPKTDLSMKDRRGTFVVLYEPNWKKIKGKTHSRVQAWMDGYRVFNEDDNHPEEEFTWPRDEY